MVFATPAAASFASKCGISVDEILFKDFGKGEVLYHKQKKFLELFQKSF